MPVSQAKRRKRFSPGQIYTQGMYAAVNLDGTEQDSQAEITVQRDSTLRQVIVQMKMDLNADGEYGVAELALQGNFQANVNDVSGQLAVSKIAFSTQGSTGGAATFENIVFHPNMDFYAGEKIYLNTEGTSGRALWYNAVFYWENRER